MWTHNMLSQQMIGSLAPVSMFARPTLKNVEALSICQTLQFGCTSPAIASTAAWTQLVGQSTRSPVADDDCELSRRVQGKP